MCTVPNVSYATSYRTATTLSTDVFPLSLNAPDPSSPNELVTTHYKFKKWVTDVHRKFQTRYANVFLCVLHPDPFNHPVVRGMYLELCNLGRRTGPMVLLKRSTDTISLWPSLLKLFVKQCTINVIYPKLKIMYIKQDKVLEKRRTKESVALVEEVVKFPVHRCGFCLRAILTGEVILQRSLLLLLTRTQWMIPLSRIHDAVVDTVITMT